MVNVLIAEDNKCLLENLQTMFEMYGFEVRIASDGIAAIDCLMEQLPDIFILNFEMPGADGLEVAQVLHNLDPTGRVHTVVLSASAQYEPQKFEQLATYVDVLLEKPFSVTQLVKMVSKTVN